MNKPSDIIWNIPFYFFIFLGLFISIKFVFIFFFRAAFEPQFIFELTPFYIFSGVSNLQLLFLSLIVVGYDTYLHIQATRKNILHSFIPTALMLSGLGLGITTKEISISSFVHYIIFGILLFVMVIDHRRTLIFPEMLPSEKLPKPSPFTSKIKLPFFARYKPKGAPTTTKPRLSLSAVTSLFSIFKRGKKVSTLEKKRKMTAEPKSSTSEAQKKEESVEKPESKEQPEKDVSPQDIGSQEPSHVFGGQSGGTGEGVSGLPQGKGAATLQSTPQTVGTIPYYKDQIPTGTKPKLSPSIITSVFGKRKKSREPERRATIPVKSQAVSSPKEDQTDEQLFAPEEKPLGKLQITQELKKELEEAVFPIVAESTEYMKEGEKQKITGDEVKKSIVTKQDIETKREDLKNRQKEIEGKITIFKDLQTNYENIQSGLDSLKNELENICKDLRLTDRESEAMKVKAKKIDLKKDISEETMVHPYLSDSEKISMAKIVKPLTYPIKSKKSDKRKYDLLKAKTILTKLEKRVEKLEHVFVK